MFYVQDDFDVSDDDPPSVRAARNPNPQVLISVLNEGARLINNLAPNPGPKISYFEYMYSVNSYISGAIHGVYNSPLVSAVEACLPHNVAILLASGAHPDGILLKDLDEYSVRFIRGRNPEYDTYSFVLCPPRAKVMAAVGDEIPQTAPLSANEIAIRRKVFSRFWSEPELPTQRFRSLPARTALETAARVGDVELFDQVRAAGPDESWWIIDPTPHQLPDALTHSVLCTSSPCHEAIIAGKTDMLRHLLALGYSPNILPLAAPTRCFPPHMAAIAFCDPPNLEAYDVLVHNGADLNLRTPIFSIHVLHLATARLDVPLLQHLVNNPDMPLEAAGTTALGHTLLHISTLPSEDGHINIFSLKNFRSIHDVRTLKTKHYLPMDLRLRNPARRSIFHCAVAKLPLPHPRTAEDEEDSRRQEEMVLWLLQTGTQDVAAQDIYGNTPLHYLASAMWVNNELLGKARAWEGGETVWKSSRNELGYTPEELLEDGKQVEKEQWKEFWMESGAFNYDMTW